MAFYFLISVIAFGYIVLWSIRNDRAGSVKEQTGLLRMSAPGELPDSESAAHDKEAIGKPRARMNGSDHRPGPKRMRGPGR